MNDHLGTWHPHEPSPVLQEFLYPHLIPTKVSSLQEKSNTYSRIISLLRVSSFREGRALYVWIISIALQIFVHFGEKLKMLDARPKTYTANIDPIIALDSPRREIDSHFDSSATWTFMTGTVGSIKHSPHMWVLLCLHFHIYMFSQTSWLVPCRSHILHALLHRHAFSTATQSSRRKPGAHALRTIPSLLLWVKNQSFGTTLKFCKNNMMAIKHV